MSGPTTSPAPTTSSAVLREARRLIRQASRPPRSGSSRAYLAYVIVVVLGLYVVPYLYQLVHHLSHRDLLDRAAGDAVLAILRGLVLLALFLAVMAGQVHGAVAPGGGYVDSVVASPLPRRSTLAREWRRSLQVCLGVGACVGVIVSVIVLTVRPHQIALVVGLVATSIGVGAILAACWLAGQFRRVRLVVLVVLAAGAVLEAAGAVAVRGNRGVAASDVMRSVVTAMTPWGWVSNVWHAGATGTATLLTWLSVLGVAVLGAIATLWRRPLEVLQIEDLRAQARRNSGAHDSALALDLRAGRTQLVAETTIGRSLRLRPGARRWGIIAARDLLGLCRTPSATGLALVLMVAGGTTLSTTFDGGSLVQVVRPVALGLGYLGLAVSAEGLRMHADNIGTSRLLGLAFVATAWCHLLAPLVLWLAAGLAAGAVLTSIGAASWAGVAWTLALGFFLAPLVVAAAFRGNVPLWLFTSFGSPMGDIGPVMVAGWYARQLLIAVIGGLLATFAVTASSPSASRTGVVLLALIAAAACSWAHTRVEAQLASHRG